MLLERHPLQVLAGTRVLAILRGLTPDEVLPVARALAEGGIRALEVTLDSPGSLESLRLLRQLGGPGFLLGAGTVLDSGAAEKALQAGAQFLVTPGVLTDVAAVAREERVPAILGALTPSEVLAAHRAGAAMVKLFPATSVGPEYIRLLRAPLGHVPLLATGGITHENARQYIQAGCASVGVGAHLTDRAAIAAQDWATLTARARRLVESIAS